MNRKLAFFALFLLPMALFLATCTSDGERSNPSPGTQTQTDISVTSTTDVVNGDVSSISALIANPGPDGISLCEAITAVNSEAGPHTITFSPTLIGQTISLTSRLPELTKDQVTVVGIKGTDGEPAVTIAGPSNAPPSSLGILPVFASDFTISDMRFVNVLAGAPAAIFIGAGSVPEIMIAPARIANVHIQGCIFTNLGLSNTVYGILIATNRGGGGSPGAAITDVTIANNRFYHNAMVLVEAGGTNSLIENVAIERNEFSNEGADAVNFGLGIGPADFSVGSSISNVMITDNTFTNFSGNADGIGIGCAGTNGQIDTVLISGNRFSDSTIPIEMAPSG